MVGSEARKSNRVAVSWRARVLVQGDQFIEGRTLNVSESGVALLMERKFPDGMVLSVALAVPDPDERTRLRPITLTAKVVFHIASGAGFKLGLQFLQIDAAATQLLRRWVVLLG